MESKISRRLKQPLAQEIIQNIPLPRLTREFHGNFEMLTQINLAHLLMLEEQGVLDHDICKKLAKALTQMHAEGPEAVELDPAREEAYFNYEAHLISLVGPDIGGRLHTGRSRNDMGATVDRIRARDYEIRITQALKNVVALAISKAEEFSDAVMPGYTHMQAAQPITLGYYFSALADAWTRDIGRLLNALETTDASPLGACALAGTSFSIDRFSTSALLGFSQPVASALDSVASRDFVLELNGALTIMMVTCSRMAQDFYIWSTPEFGYLAFPDSVSTTSSIMPQKKNPMVLEYLRGKSANFIGNSASALSVVKSTAFSHAGDSSREGSRICWESCEEALRCLQLVELLIRNVELQRARMVARAAEDFSAVTDLADLLVRDADISFRDAHHIIGAVVRDAMDKGITSKGITAAMISSAAEAQIERPVLLREQAVSECLDPVRNVNARNSYGAPAPQLVRERAVHQRRHLEEKASVLEAAVNRIQLARLELFNRANSLAADAVSDSASF
ncbi:argininosuccinate lyase [uncultured Xylophilus sp.]|uniref:argininosuccinate lyase n=1 Tax=uncultured Xylophilus sp. TaxID=296832 RepID=UPI0025F0E976|nr:argininosuccinate lyase [uncultured Xylophilus sp.]